MLKKLIEGFVFGTGFGIAFVAIFLLGTHIIMPKIIENATKQPIFHEPKPAELAKPKSGPSVYPKEFSFFKHSGSRMEIPDGGGILAMSPMSTPIDATRPSTYQLWLTHQELWQIRTIADKVEIEKLTYPENASVESLDTIMQEKLGMAALQSTMTVSRTVINELNSGQDTIRDETLNGKLQITVEGVVFVLPNPFET